MNTPVKNSAKNKVLAAILFVGSLVIFLGVTEVVVGHYEKQNMNVPRLVYYLMRIPDEADHDSALMATAIPESCRPAFRWEADRNSGACRPVF